MTRTRHFGVAGFVAPGYLPGPFSLVRSTTMHAAAPHPRRDVWLREVRETLALTAPLALTQLGHVAMLTTDVVLIGRLGEEALAAGALGHVVLFSAFVIGMGTVMATAPLAAQAFGAKRPRTLRRVVRQGLWVALLLTVPFCLLVAPVAGGMLRLLGQPPTVAALAHEFLSTLLWCLPGAIGFTVLRNFAAAVDRPMPALWVMLAGVPVNALLAWALIFGRLGAPRLELAGAGLASALVNFAMFVAMLFIATRMAPFRRYRILGRFWRPDWVIFRRIFTLGLPIAGVFLMEYGIIAFAAVMMGWIGATAIAAHQIALQIASISFMVPFGIGQAATVRVGHALGRGDPEGVRRAGWCAFALGLVFMAGMSLLIVTMPATLAALFIDPAAPGGARVVELAAGLLLIAAAFQLSDGAQTIGLQALRGLNDTTVPMAIALAGYWAIGFPAGYGLGFVAGWGATGIWIGLAAGLGAVAVMATWRFVRMTSPGAVRALGAVGR
jgi:multidrug resistance protein, MATE family